MPAHDFISRLSMPNNTKLVLLVLDGLGGSSHSGFSHKTELEAAETPSLDRLASEGTTGLLTPVLPGVTPGSGPGHLALFGYDPQEVLIGRGVLECLGIGITPNPSDALARGNFCTLNQDGTIADRRAGRMSAKECEERLNLLRSIHIPGVSIHLHPVKDYRFVVRLIGDGLDGNIGDTDPGSVGVAPLNASALQQAAGRTAEIFNTFIAETCRLLAQRDEGNGILLRGFSMLPDIPSLATLYGLRAAALAVYPMYKGLARVAGMDVLDCGNTLPEQLSTLKQIWDDYDYFFVHYKYTDSSGEDGDFAAKVSHIETVDRWIPSIVELQPSVLAVTGDHSTPASLRSHSWHPVPFLLVADTCRRDAVLTFSETACSSGGFGQLYARHLMSLMLAHAGRLSKFGA